MSEQRPSDDRVRHTFVVEIDGEADGFASNTAQIEQALWESMDRGPLTRVWSVRLAQTVTLQPVEESP